MVIMEVQVLLVGIDAGYGVNYGQTNDVSSFDGEYYSHSGGTNKFGGGTQYFDSTVQNETGWSYSYGPSVPLGFHQTYGIGGYIKAKRESYPNLSFEGP